MPLLVSFANTNNGKQNTNNCTKYLLLVSFANNNNGKKKPSYHYLLYLWHEERSSKKNTGVQRLYAGL